MTDPRRSLLGQLAARLTVPGLQWAGDIAGLSCLVTGAFLLAVWAGLIALGVALLLLSVRGDG